MPIRDVLLAIALTCAWGFNFVVIRVGIDNFPPLLFSALRFSLACFPLILFMRKPNVPWSIILGVGVVLGVIKFSLLFIGIDVGISAGIASLVLQTQAFFTVIFAALIFSERPTKQQILGIAIAFIGIAVVGTTVDQNITIVGLSLTICAGVAWAVSNLIMKKAGSVNMLNLMVWMSVIPPIPLFIMSLTFEGHDVMLEAIQNVKWQGIGALIYVSFVATILGFATWGHLIKKHGAGKVAPFSLLVPIFGMGSSAIFLNESFDAIRIMAAVLVMTGLILTVLKPRAHR